jgi:hypothetical protein
MAFFSTSFQLHSSAFSACYLYFAIQASNTQAVIGLACLGGLNSFHQSSV